MIDISQTQPSTGQGGDSGSKKCKSGYGGTYGGVLRSPESEDPFGVSAFARNLATVAVKTS